jgi:hypothetical protein
MKKIWKHLVFAMVYLLSQAKCEAQITLEAQIDSSAWGFLWKMVQISSTETKYCFKDTVNNTFSLFNMDFSPFITNIQVPDPWASFTTEYYEAYYITRDLFDCDTSNMEFVFAAPLTFNKPFRVLRTDGTVLFQLDSAAGLYCAGDCGNGGSDILSPITNTSASARMVLTKINSGHEVDYIYSLCGSLPVQAFDFTGVSQSYVRIFPNPTAGVLAFQINLPDNKNEYELVILDSRGRELKRQNVNTLGRVFSIDVKDFDSGAYVYSLCTKYKTYQNGKFIINK